MIGDLCARMWNELNYERMQLFKRSKEEGGKLTPEAMRETQKKCYEKYKGLVGSATAQQIANMNNEAWASFFAMLKAKRGEAPALHQEGQPSRLLEGSRAGREGQEDTYTVYRYVVEPVNAGEGYIEVAIARGRRMRIKYAGKLRWAGRQGRMIIVKEAGKWFAYIPVEVGARPPRSSPRGYIRGGLDRIRQREPRGNEVAFVDMGLNNLFAIVTTSGNAALVKGRAVKAEHYREKSEIRAMQGTRDKLKNNGLEVWRKFHHRYLRAYFKWRERLRHLYRTAIRFTAEWLYARGVERVYLGYPYMVSQDNGDEYNTNIWWFRKVSKWLYEVLQEYGIELYIVLEYGTSRECSICHIEHGGTRVHRGLYICEKTGKKLNADLNAAVNIAHRVGYRVTIKKIESYGVTHNGVKPVTPTRGAARDPSIGNPVLQGREGVI